MHLGPSSKQERVLFGFIAITLLLGFFALTNLYTKHWEANFDSDHAFIGLAAKGIAFEGERPIFMGNLGYHGMLLGGYLPAIYFRIFGVSPETFMFSPITYFFLLLIAVFFLLRRLFDPWVALVGCSALIFSSPYLYALFARPMLLVQTCLIGTLIFLTYPSWFQCITAKDSTDQKKLLWSILLGFLCGFALYEFRLTAFFILSVLAHFLWYEQGPHASIPTVIRTFFSPHREISSPRQRRVFYLLTLIARIVLVLGLICLVFNIRQFAMFGKIVRINAINTVLIPTVFFIVIFIGRTLKKAFHEGHLSRTSLGALSVAAFIGFSPTLIYFHLLDGTGGRGIALRGTIADIFRRFGYAAHMHIEHFNLESGDINDWLIGAILLAATVTFCGNQWRKATKREQSSLHFPILILPLITISGFVLSSRILAVEWNRYVMPLVIFYAAAFGWCVVYLYRKFSSPLFRLSLISFWIAICVHNTNHIWQSIQSPSKENIRSPKIIAEVKRLNLPAVWASYWNAYLSTFRSNEAALVVPYDQFYLEKYAEKAKSFPTVGLLVIDGEPTPDLGSVHTIAGLKYKVEEKLSHLHDFAIFKLNRL